MATEETTPGGGECLTDRFDKALQGGQERLQCRSATGPSLSARRCGAPTPEGKYG